MTSQRQQSNDVNMQNNENSNKDNTNDSNNNNNNTNNNNNSNNNNNNNDNNTNKKKKPKKQGKKRFSFKKVLAKTLQGRIYLAVDRENKGTDKQWCIVKETWKELVRTGKSRDGHNVPEDFHNEKRLHKLLSELAEVSSESGFVKCIEEWEDQHCFYLAMDYCTGGELFDWIRDQHSSGPVSSLTQRAGQMTQAPSRSTNKWQDNVQSLFRQLVKTVSFFHRNNIVHLDLSLENTMLGKPLETKIIDFGLGKQFDLNNNPNFKNNKRVGKTGYMAPEVFNKKEYDSRAADIWSLGVMLFMMLIGAPPYEYPNKTNPAFNFIINGKLKDVLKHWRRLPLITVDALDLLNKIFRYEDKRITMKQIREHKYVSLGNEPEPEYLTENNTNIKEPMDPDDTEINDKFTNNKETTSNNTNNTKDDDGDDDMTDRTNNNNQDNNTQQNTTQAPEENEEIQDSTSCTAISNGKKVSINLKTTTAMEFLNEVTKENKDISKVPLSIIKDVQLKVEKELNKLLKSLTDKQEKEKEEEQQGEEDDDIEEEQQGEDTDTTMQPSTTEEAGEIKKEQEQCKDIDGNDKNCQTCIKELQELKSFLQDIMGSNENKTSDGTVVL